MNDRFKFRVWNKSLEKYVNNINISPFGLLVFIGSVFCFIDNNYVVEQCTGLKDKNGNLIYEGDIVEITIFGSIGPNGGYVDSDTQYQGVVVWAEQGFYVKVVDNFFYIPEEPEDVEIVGNIHEQAERKDVK